MICLVKKLFLSSIAESLWELGWGMSGRGSANGTECLDGIGAVTGLVRRRFFYRLPVVKRKTAGKGLVVGFSDFYFGF